MSTLCLRPVSPQYGWVSSAQQQPIGQPVCSEPAGFEATITTRVGGSGLRMSATAVICAILTGHGDANTDGVWRR